MELKDRLKKARKYAGLTQKEIESRIKGLKQSSYSELERGESKSSTKLIELATLFQVDPVWLATGDGEMLTKPSPSDLMQKIKEIENGGARDSSIAPKGTVNAPMADVSDEVPILSWVAAGSWSNVEAVTFDDAIGKVSRPKNLSKNGFALIVRGESMLPKFDPDDIIYVEPQTGLFALKNNDLVIVQCNDDTEATFKQLVLGETSEDMYLRPLNPNWHEQKMTPMGDCNLVGKVVGKYVEY
ncbi:helix-turn-helix domain-containing protein [Psychrobacter faecalis]|uniref:helix-turn-helix domain-containing protein n=1 Tax=Psychrobacter faecalis TaxID=180588 RepID=UPI0028A9C4FA|nr:XRE family transcriptional regulator [Psychrobacter faecalis]